MFIGIIDEQYICVVSMRFPVNIINNTSFQVVFDSNRLTSNVFQVTNGAVSAIGEGSPGTNIDHYEDANIIIRNTTITTRLRYSNINRYDLKEMPSNLA